MWGLRNYWKGGAMYLSEIRFSTLGNRAKNESYEEGLYFDQDVLTGPFRVELSNHSV